ncbi:MAG: hypothetical protein Q9191_000567 [Dirinaria sp. TL-2023a]
MDDDVFGDLLSLENQFYKEGYHLGVEDGCRAGLIEGRFFGLEKGFDKYVSSGKMHGQVNIWANRLPLKERYGQTHASSQDNNTMARQQAKGSKGDQSHQQSEVRGVASDSLPNLPKAERLAKHIRTLYALVEPSSLSTGNDEEAVSDFDDRLKRAEGKVKVIEKIIEKAIAESKPSTSMSDEIGHGRAQKVDRGIEDITH